MQLGPWLDVRRAFSALLEISLETHLIAKDLLEGIVFSIVPTSTFLEKGRSFFVEFEGLLSFFQCVLKLKDCFFIELVCHDVVVENVHFGVRALMELMLATRGMTRSVPSGPSLGSAV